MWCRRGLFCLALLCFIRAKLSAEEPQSPNANPGDELAKPVSLDAQNGLRADLRAKLRRVKGGKNGGKKKGKVSSDKGGEDAAPATKRKRGTCESEPAASSLPKAKAKAKGKAKAVPSPKATAKGKAKATAKGKAKAKSRREGLSIVVLLSS